MSDDLRPALRTTPRHLWLVCSVFVFLYGIGAYDYIQVQLGSADYYQAQGYGPAQVEYFTDYPWLPLIFWTANITAGIAAVALLALRRRWAVTAAAVAALSALCLQIITFGFMDRWSILGPRLSLPDIGIMLLTFGLWLYTHRMKHRGVLT